MPFPRLAPQAEHDPPALPSLLWVEILLICAMAGLFALA